MALESSVTYISDLVVTNPTTTDPRSEGDDHLRNIKKALVNTFPNVNAAVTVTDTELNYLAGLTSTVSTALAAKANIASPTFTGTVTVPVLTVNDNATFPANVTIGTVSAAELNFLDGVTANLQTQLNAKAGLTNPAFTGNPTASTPLFTDDSTKLATTAFVQMETVALHVAPAGTPAYCSKSSGFTVTRVAAGQYQITHPFGGDIRSGRFAVSVQPIKPFGSSASFFDPVIIDTSDATTFYVWLYARNMGSASATLTDMYFMVLFRYIHGD